MENGSEDALVHLVESVLVDVEHGEGLVGDVPGDPVVGFHLGVIAHPAQQVVGDARRAAGAAPNLPSPFPLNENFLETLADATDCCVGLLHADTALAGARDASQHAENVATGELERPLPKVRRQISRMDIRRWGHAMVRPAPGLMWGGTREALRKPLGKIHFAGNDAGILPLYEEAIYQGVAAAEAVLTRLGRPYHSLIEPDRERLD